MLSTVRDTMVPKRTDSEERAIQNSAQSGSSDAYQNG
jgi:hypothetical protein